MTSSAPRRILIVDDEPDLVRVLVDILSAQGYEAEGAASGLEALRKSRTLRPDLLLLDVLLTDTTGFDVMDRLRGDPATRHIPVILMSTLDSPGAELGVKPPIEPERVFTKPLDIDDLLGCIQRTLGGSFGAGTAAARKVLIVDDDEQFTEMLDAFLRSKGFVPSAVALGAGALEAARRERPDVILLDLLLPDMNGLRVAEMLRQDPETRAIPVLLLTGLKLGSFLEDGVWVTLPRDPAVIRRQQEKLLREIERRLEPVGNPRRDRPRILVADDEPDINQIIHDILVQDGFDVVTAFNGSEALEKIRSASPDLVVLDVKMPELDGYEICRRLKEDVVLRSLPVILLTVMADTGHKVRGLDTGADDYVTKPFVPEELLARVRMVLRRTRQTLEANPLTRLPGNVSIEKEITRRIAEDLPFAVLYVDLNQFKSYNDAYGFERGDRVIVAAARVVLESVGAAGGAEDFVGHIGGDDFIVVTTPERMDAVGRSIVRLFDGVVPGLYDAPDRERGFIVAKDRRGRENRFPLLSVSVGAISTECGKFRAYGEVSALGAEMKKAAKAEAGSAYKADRRRRDPEP